MRWLRGHSSQHLCGLVIDLRQDFLRGSENNTFTYTFSPCLFDSYNRSWNLCGVWYDGKSSWENDDVIFVLNLMNFYYHHYYSLLWSSVTATYVDYVMQTNLFHSDCIVHFCGHFSSHMWIGVTLLCAFILSQFSSESFFILMYCPFFRPRCIYRYDCTETAVWNTCVQTVKKANAGVTFDMLWWCTVYVTYCAIPLSTGVLHKLHSKQYTSSMP